MPNLKQERQTAEAAGAESHGIAKALLIPRKSVLPTTALILLSSLSAVQALVIIFVDLPREALGLLVMGFLLTSLFSGLPIAWVMGASAMLGLYKFGGWRVVESSFSDLIYDSTASWQLSVIPLFVVLGIALWRSGVTTLAFDAARLWMGRLPGGLAVATNASGAGLAAASGSTMGIAIALGRMAIPEMLKAGYHRGLATSVVAMSGTLGAMIPPSVLLVIYAGVVEVSVGKQLLAAIVPGISVAVLFCVYIMIRATLQPTWAPKGESQQVSVAAKLRSLVGVIPLAVVVLTVIGGMLSGVFTATEAAGAGAVAAMLVGIGTVIRNKGRGKEIRSFIVDVASETVSSTAAIFLVLIGVQLLSKVIALTRLTNVVSDFIIGLNLNMITLPLALMVLYLFLGMFLGPLEMILLTVPVLMGALTATGVDLIWFGVFLVVLCEVAIVSPPVGMLVFVVHKQAQKREVNLGQRISLTDVFKGVLPFIAVIVGFLIVTIFFPDIMLALPNGAPAP